MNEVSPPGWKGSVKAMKKHDIDNPWALAWHMKKKGNKPSFKAFASLLVVISLFASGLYFALTKTCFLISYRSKF